jgi:hypothetical protein
VKLGFEVKAFTRPALELLLECTVCRQCMRSERRREESIEAVLFGAKRYAFCPGCLQAVPEEIQKDTLFRRRWGRRASFIQKKISQQRAIARFTK